METLKKGQKVAVNTVNGRVVRRVWEDLGWAVEICSDRQFEALQRGDESAQAIGFRREEIEAISD